MTKSYSKKELEYFMSDAWIEGWIAGKENKIVDSAIWHTWRKGPPKKGEKK